MGRVIVSEWMSLDGVVQAPGAADEDRTGGFDHGGWHLPYFDGRSRDWVVEGLRAAGGFLFGRDPVLVGGGKRVFSDDGALRPLRLAHSEITTTGAVLATYALADD